MAEIDKKVLAWEDGRIVKFAQTIYDERRSEWMPILADMLEQAGCEDGEVLAHCRDGEHHPRGCWVIDNILNKK